MIGMQSSLDRILSAIQSQGQNQNQAPLPNPGLVPSNYPTGPSRDSPGLPGTSPSLDTAASVFNALLARVDGPSRSRTFPPLPGFAPPVRSEDVSEPE